MVVATQKRNRAVSGGKRTSAVAAGPGESREAMAVVPTGWGLCGVVWRTAGAVESPFAEKPPALLSRILTPGLSHGALRRQLLEQHPGCREVIGQGNLAAGQVRFHPEVVPEWFGELVRFLEGYYSNSVREWAQPQVVEHWTYWRPRLDWSRVTEFQRKVLEAVAEIGCGVQLTYGQVAKKVGKPSASRAVGAAIGSNPWPVLVPCHRVIGSDGNLTGFSAPGGVAAKQRMLEMEGAAGLWGRVRA
jgi:O-6-methylguanine DNA methyltransferase